MSRDRSDAPVILFSELADFVFNLQNAFTHLGEICQQFLNKPRKNFKRNQVQPRIYKSRGPYKAKSLQKTAQDAVNQSQDLGQLYDTVFPDDAWDQPIEFAGEDIEERAEQNKNSHDQFEFPTMGDHSSQKGPTFEEFFTIEKARILSHDPDIAEEKVIDRSMSKWNSMTLQQRKAYVMSLRNQKAQRKEYKPRSEEKGDQFTSKFKNFFKGTPTSRQAPAQRRRERKVQTKQSNPETSSTRMRSPEQIEMENKFNKIFER